MIKRIRHRNKHSRPKCAIKLYNLRMEIHLLHSALVLNNPVLYTDCLMLTFSFDPQFAQYPNAIVNNLTT